MSGRPFQGAGTVDAVMSVREAFMKQTALLLGFTLTIGIAIGGIGTRILNAQPEPVKKTELLMTELTSMEGKEANLVLVEFEPGAAVAKHYHPGDELVYILEGSISLEPEGKPAITLKAGDAFHQPPNQVHSGRNVSMTGPAKLLVVWIVRKGQAISIPVK